VSRLDDRVGREHLAGLCHERDPRLVWEAVQLAGEHPLPCGRRDPLVEELDPPDRRGPRTLGDQLLGDPGLGCDLLRRVGPRHLGILARGRAVTELAKWCCVSIDRQGTKAAAFRSLHESGTFVIPNPWDVGSARVLEALGFRALATTSSGFAFTLGRLDGGVTLDEMVEHARELDRATELPVSVDLENGYGPDPEHAATAIRRAAEEGAVGGSIEDYDRDGYLYPLDLAAERISAAVEAARGLPFPFTLTARAENHIRGNPDLPDTIRRLQAFEQAGADVLYAPGLREIDDIRAVCRSVGRPVNVLAVPGVTVAELAEAGARRVSVGGGLSWVAVQALAEAATAIRDTGDLSALAAKVPLTDWLGR
jgi:2-methylisocitrate lyase-like PEP mutase family enzyme